MTEFYRQYLAVAVFVLAALLMVGAMLGVGRLLRPNVPQDEKYVTYESGSDPTGRFGQANVRYYLYALIFLIFDIEIVYILPWAVAFNDLGLIAFVEMLIFVAILVVALAYVWRKKAIGWE